MKHFTLLRQRAFTIVEAVLCMIVVALMLAAAFSVSGQSAKARQVIAEQRTAELLSRRLLAEIMQKRYREPAGDADAGEDQRIRLTLDDVDDYNNLTLSPPTDIFDQSISNTSGWKQTVKIEFIRMDAATKTFVADVTDTGLKRITVTTTSPRGVVSSVVAIRTDQGISDTYTPDAGTTRSAMISVTPTGGAPVSVVTPLFNSPAP
jgi:type II secretory pathway pseudopilin PulG